MATANQEIRELKNEVKQLAEMVQDNLSTAGHDGHGIGDMIGEYRTDLRRVARKAGRNVRHFVSDSGKKAGALCKRCEENISEHPLRSVAVAVAGGLLLGALMKRK